MADEQRRNRSRSRDADTEVAEKENTEAEVETKEETETETKADAGEGGDLGETATEETASEEGGKPLFELIAEHSGIKMEDGQKLDDYKRVLVKHYNAFDDAAFEKLEEDHPAISDWVSDAVAAIKKDKDKATLPELAGEPKPRRGRRAKAEGDGEVKEKPERKTRNPEANRYFQIPEHLLLKPNLRTMSPEEIESALDGKYTSTTIKYAKEAFVGVVAVLKKHKDEARKILEL